MLASFAKLIYRKEFFLSSVRWKGKTELYFQEKA